MSEEKSSVSKEKSAMYPAYTLNEILDSFINVIDTLGGKKASTELVASTLGVSSSTKSFTRKLSAARQYGLINLSKGTIELTDLANSILYPISENINVYMLEAFSKPPVYEKLIERYNHRALPNNFVLSNILLEPEFAITKNVKDLVIEKFIENCKDLGLIKNGILEFSLNQSIETKEVEPIVVNNDKSIPNKLDTSIASCESEYQEMSIPLPGKKQQIKIIIPNDCGVADYQFLQKYIEAVLPMYIENIKK